MRPSSASGQASLDYVAVLALVGVTLALAAGAAGASGAGVGGAPWAAARMAQAIRHGICVVSGSFCTPAEARTAGLAPCPIHRRSNAERLRVTAVVRLERGDALLVERRSDGSASVSFVDGGAAGVEVGIGVKLPHAGGTLDAGGGVRFSAGQVHEFASWPAARRFLRRFAGEETMTGEGRRALRKLCWRCPEWLDGRGRELPEPAARFHEGGTYAALSAALGLGPVAELDARLDAARVIGRRVAGRRTTWYLGLESTVTAELGAVLGSFSAARETAGVLELTTEGGEPVEARVRAAAALAGEGQLAGRGLDIADLTERLRGAAARPRRDGDLGGLAVEAQVTLDLRDPANRRAVEGLLRTGLSPLAWADRVRAVGRRLDLAGAVDLDVFRTTRTDRLHEAEIGAAVKLGAGYGRVEQVRDLIAAWSTAAGGGPVRRREDCEEAARLLAA